MAKSVKLTKFRRQLIRSCEDLVSKFLESERLLTIGHAADQIVRHGTRGGAPTSGDTSSDAVATQYDVNPSGLSDLLVLVQATLVQEWLIFLDSVFGEAVLYCLKNNLASRLPMLSLGVKKLEPTSLVKMRESICYALREAFSFNRNYPDKIKTLHKMFKVPADKKLQGEMKKHVTIRNIFQHHRGVIRPRDLNAIGKQDFEMLDDAGNQKAYKKGELIVLSKLEVVSLKDVIKRYSQKFEVLS